MSDTSLHIRIGLKYALPLSLFLLLFFVFIFLGNASTFGCSEVAGQPPEKGSQGYRIWHGEDLVSFYHHNKTVCISDGWRPVGAAQVTSIGAQFETQKTGILIRSDAFSERILDPDLSSYRITLVYPKDTPKEALDSIEHIVLRAFNNTGALFADPRYESIEHTVLVTAGLDKKLIYPDPRSSVTVFVRDPSDTRAEELLIHAVMHLYNRFNSAYTSYQSHQTPIPSKDFQELEATWAETAFHSSSEARAARIAYLYNLHTAVTINDFTQITAPPFINDKRAFDAIVPTVTPGNNASHFDRQYGHYVLGPLVMLATEGLLIERGADVDMRTLLFQLHTHKSRNFFDELSYHLTTEDIETIVSWMHEETILPRDLLERALDHY